MQKPDERNETVAERVGVRSEPGVPRHPDAASWRAATPDDLDRIMEFVAVCDQVDHPTWVTPREDIEEVFEVSYIDAERDTLLGLDDDGAIIAFGTVTPHPARDVSLHMYIDGRVHPRLRRRGIGRQLMAWEHERALQALAEVPETTLPAAVFVHAEEGNTAARHLALRRGMHEERWFTTMVRDLREPIRDVVMVTGAAAGAAAEAERPAPTDAGTGSAADPGPQAPTDAGTGSVADAERPALGGAAIGVVADAGPPAHGDAASGADAASDSISIVEFAEQWKEPARLARNDSFRDHWGSLETPPERWARFVNGELIRPDLSRIAVEGDRVVAFALGSVNEEDWAAQGYSSVYIDLVGVVRDRRGRHLASAVITALMIAARDAGLDKAVLDVDAASPTGADRLYTGLGFAPTERMVALVARY